MIFIETHDQWRTAIHGDRISVFMFSSKFCSDCTYIAPFLPEIEADFPNLDFYQVDRDMFMDDCLSLGIIGIPSFLIFQNGREKGRFVSKQRKTKEEIKNFLQSIVKTEGEHA